MVGVALSFIELFNLTIVPAKSDNGPDSVPLLSLLSLTETAGGEASDAPDRERVGEGINVPADESGLPISFPFSPRISLAPRNVARLVTVRAMDRSLPLSWKSASGSVGPEH